jgi:phosphogluconate dehydratase
MHSTVEKVTERIRKRSEQTRRAYLEKIDRSQPGGRRRRQMACSNLAHGMAACSAADKTRLQTEGTLNIGIVSAYNDMLSAHQPYQRYPEVIRAAAAQFGAVAQFAGGVPAMCDGVTQGEAGMDLSLFSRDVIALSTAVALSHEMFDGVLCLGICDKIVPGLLIGALSFGHLPVLFVPAGPMPSGISNREKARVREAFAQGEADRKDLLASESAAYHSPGTCTFYGTANSNQMLMEFMGLQLPGGSFVNPDHPMRDLLTAEAVSQVLQLTAEGENYTPLARLLDEKAIVNGMVGLLTTGGSTNHTIHLVAIARAAGVRIDWSDFAELSQAVPLLARVYPNGLADVNQFHAAGGLGFLIRELLEAGLLHDDVLTIRGSGLHRFASAPVLENDRLHWQPAEQSSGDRSVLREFADPFQQEGGLRLVEGNIGRAIVKISAVAEQHQAIEAPARVFTSQDAFIEAFEAGELNRDLVAVVIGQGPRANGMPELHQLTPFLGVLQNKGYRVALLTDGRMSGASGKVLAAIQVTPEAANGGAIARLRDGDLVRIDAVAGVLETDQDLTDRAAISIDLSRHSQGTGRELFGVFRQNAGSAEEGAGIFEECEWTPAS